MVGVLINFGCSKQPMRSYTIVCRNRWIVMALLPFKYKKNIRKFCLFLIKIIAIESQSMFGSAINQLTGLKTQSTTLWRCLKVDL